jgi:hypothetical protein
MTEVVHMLRYERLWRVSLCVAILSACALGTVANSADALEAPSVLTFKELDAGGTSHFVDTAPEATVEHGVATISPGDTLIYTNPLAMEGGIAGKIRIVCVATESGNSKNPATAGFDCTGLAKLPSGSLVLVAELGKSPVEGAVTGGTRMFAGARGTFVSRKGRGFSTTTVTLIE